MLQRISVAPESASNAAVAADSETGVGCDSEDWFGSIARELLGKDAGFALFLLTGVPEGSCYKYCTKQAHNRRQPPGYLIRQILRSEQGWTWLAALMDGAEPQWWRDLQAARDLCIHYEVRKR